MTKDLKNNLVSTAIVSVVIVIIGLLWKDLKKAANTNIVNPSSLSLSVPATHYGDINYNVPALPADNITFGNNTPEQFQSLLFPQTNLPYSMGNCYSCATTNNNPGVAPNTVATPVTQSGPIVQAIQNIGSWFTQ